MAAADEVIVTVNPQLLAMKGLQDFLKTVRKIRNRVNEKLNVAGILLTMCDGRTKLCKTPSTVKVGESIYYSEPLLEYASDSSACRAYERLAGEVIAYEG